MVQGDVAASVTVDNVFAPSSAPRCLQSTDGTAATTARRTSPCAQKSPAVAPLEPLFWGHESCPLRAETGGPTCTPADSGALCLAGSSRCLPQHLQSHMGAHEGEGVGPGGHLLPLSGLHTPHPPCDCSWSPATEPGPGPPAATEPGPGPLTATEPCLTLRVVSTVVGALLGVLLLGLLGLLGLWGLRRVQQRGTPIPQSPRLA